MTVGTKEGSLWKGGLSSGSGKHETVDPENRENGLKELIRWSLGIVRPEVSVDLGKPTWRVIKCDSSNNSLEEHDADKGKGCPSKFLTTCLNSVQEALYQDEPYNSEDDMPYFTDSWGFDFWSCYNKGIDVLDKDGADSKTRKIAWIASTAADSISMKEEEEEEEAGAEAGAEEDDGSSDSPFLLYLVPSQEKASKVLEVCKPLEECGVYTLFLHSGVSMDLQIESLKSAEPEFIIATPETLLELLSLKAVDISELALMVIDGLEAPVGGTYLDAVKSIRPFISENTQTVIFCDHMNASSSSVDSKAD
ncbi:hypothetical protein SASPL_128125 [Salvia splendens]|uniref:DEAD/DEAH-box helicase domain-containing protein n=1 Tax=Salvia splendens TaxID=180675 RepID=A0A8X8XBU6_SALSN|nr:uncharacterized protein LOC121750548 [Salvia splendens]KAG6410077.1 hypothetical protein SASPL_128125 [Salvia splendens]